MLNLRAVCKRGLAGRDGERPTACSHEIFASLPTQRFEPSPKARIHQCEWAPHLLVRDPGRTSLGVGSNRRVLSSDACRPVDRQSQSSKKKWCWKPKKPQLLKKPPKQPRVETTPNRCGATDTVCALAGRAVPAVKTAVPRMPGWRWDRHLLGKLHQASLISLGIRSHIECCGWGICPSWWGGVGVQVEACAQCRPPRPVPWPVLLGGA
jgi:hypothetical protein